MAVTTTTYAPPEASRRMSSAARGRAGFGPALLAEWTKILTARSLVWTPAVMAGLVIATAVFVGATESLMPDDTVLGGSLTGVVTGQMVAAIFGVLVMSGEYGAGTILPTFTAIPRRTTVVAAKAAVVAGTLFVVALVACFVAYEIGALMLPAGTYAPGEPMPALLGVALSFSAAGVLGLAVGTILRNSAGAIVAVVGIDLVSSMFGPLFGEMQRWIVGAAPTAVVQKLAQSSDAAADIAGSLGAWPSLLIVWVYTAAALGAGAWLLKSRDT